MGRKPSQLFLEFFERGQKLEDQSNRYRYTCRKCGEFFPKGRPDALNSHLFHGCPNITEEDRVRAAFIYAEDKTRTRRGHSSSHTEQDTSMEGNDSDQHAQLPFVPQREPSALDTLAEVSRQHLDISRRRSQANGTGHEDINSLSYLLQQEVNAGNDTNGQAQAALNELGQHGVSTYGETQLSHTSHQSQTQGQESGLVQAAAAANDLQAALQRSRSAQSTPVNHMVNAPSSNGLSHQARRIMTIGKSQAQPPHVDPQLEAGEFSGLANELARVNRELDIEHSGASTPVSQPSYHTPGSTSEQYADSVSTAPTHAPAPQPMSSAQLLSGFGLLPRSHKKGGRGRFSDERRKEVSTVRKRGACIRCRMLKKPCSEGTPCSTCSSIEAARLWKNPKSLCVRTRIADEFGLYSTSYFYSLAHTKVHAARKAIDAYVPHGQIEVSLFPDTELYITFTAMTTTNAVNEGAEIDPGLIHDGKDEATSSEEPFFLDAGSDEVSGTLEHYLHMVTLTSIEHEPSTFLRATLDCATELSAQHNDALLPKAVTLWVATHILASSSHPGWSFAHSSSLASDHDNETENATTPLATERRVFNMGTPAYDIIHAQILEETEKHCQKLIKTVLTEFEKRLLQRQQSSPVLTFFIAIIILNCVERMAWLFRSCDTAGSESADGTGSTTIPPDWPLDSPPSKYWSQGDSFSELLHLLIRMRGLVPKIVLCPDDSLQVEASKIYQITMSPDGFPVADQQFLITQKWLASTGMSGQELTMRANAEFDAHDMRSWDLRYISQVLLAAG